MIGLQKDYDINKMIKWSKVFFSGNRTTVDAAYNSACGAGSARKDKIEIRINAMVSHMARYMEGVPSKVA